MSCSMKLICWSWEACVGVELCDRWSSLLNVQNRKKRGKYSTSINVQTSIMFNIELLNTNFSSWWGKHPPSEHLKWKKVK